MAAGAVLVLGVSVYLLFAVRAPAATGGGPAIAARGADEPRAQEPERSGPTGGARSARVPPTRTPPAGGELPGLRAPGSAVVREPPRGPDGAPEDPAPYKLDAVMAEANKAYDRGDLDEAKSIARKVLATSPRNVRMLRIVVSASCIMGDNAEAQEAFVLLPQFDREQMKTRCARHGVSFTEP
jgi:hypothetical protein